MRKKRKRKPEERDIYQAVRRTHVFKNEINITIIVSFQHIQKADSVVMIECLQEHDFAEGSLRIRRILKRWEATKGGRL